MTKKKPELIEYKERKHKNRQCFSSSLCGLFRFNNKKKKNTPKIIRFHKRVNQNHELIPFTAQTLPSIRTTANNSKRVTFYK